MANHRKTPIEISREEFQEVGYRLVDRLSEFIDSIEDRKVTTGKSPAEIQDILQKRSFPANGSSASELLSKASDLLIEHSLFNGHPKFLGYITSSAAPIGALADFLATAVNSNVGAEILSPMATEIERQTIQWLAEFIGVSTDYGGVLVSGGNLANFTGFLAARTAIASDKLKEEGIANTGENLIVYCSKTTHTWVEKAAILFGHGSKAIRWIKTDSNNKMDNEVLAQCIEADLEKGNAPFMVVGTAGDVSTGVIDDLEGISRICRKHELWFHIDGAYGIPAAILPELKDLFAGMEYADSIALDPHKWLYCPLEVGCTLVKNPKHLTDTFSSQPEYYNFKKDEEELSLNYYEFSLQNSRGFRALKVWLALQQVGRNGYVEMIHEDIALSRLFFKLAQEHTELQAMTQNLSITTLRYVPLDCLDESYINKLNETILDNLQKGGEVFLSNAIVDEKYCLRGCIVNFRTSKKDIEEIIEIIVREGRKIHSLLQKV